MKAKPVVHVFAPHGVGEARFLNDDRWPPREFKRLQRLIVQIALRLRLRDWTIKVSTAKWSGQADCQVLPEYKLARLRFNRHTIDKRWLPELVAHELMHIYFARFTAVAHDIVKSPGVRRRLVAAEEEVVTELAFAILMTLPPELRR